MRQVLAIVAAAVLAGLGAVVLGEYDLRGTTAIVGFPLYGVAVTELALAVARRLAVPTLAVAAAVVAGGLTWALWISFGHFRNDVLPPPLSWVMVGVAVLAAVLWGWSGRRRRPVARSGPASPVADGEPTTPAPAPSVSGRSGARDEQALP